jgi:hypothetical protein
MTTKKQIQANRINAESSTGPRTESGKSTSSANAITLGLFTRKDHVRPEDQVLYNQLAEAARNELTPAGFLEESSVSQIIGANWRLRLCDNAESELTDFSEATARTRQSIERARAHALGVLNRFLSQLRKLQTERILREQIPLGRVSHVPTADTRVLLNARYRLERLIKLSGSNGAHEAEVRLNQLLNEPLPSLTPSKIETSGKLASFCELDGAKAAQAFMEAFDALQENPNLPCTCRSGRSYAQCCGSDNPPDFEMAA